MSTSTDIAAPSGPGPALPRAMRAVVLTGHGGLDRLSVRDDWPVPNPEPGDERT